MKRYRFPLASVLRVRRIEQDQAVAAFAEARRRHDSAAETVARREAAHRAAQPAPGTISLDDFLATRASHERSADAVRRAGVELQAAASAMAARRAAVAAASAAVTALEHLDERRRDEHALEAQREETTEVDDLVTARHGRKER